MEKEAQVSPAEPVAVRGSRLIKRTKWQMMENKGWSSMWKLNKSINPYWKSRKYE